MLGARVLGARVLSARVLSARVLGLVLIMFMWCPALAGFPQHDEHQPPAKVNRGKDAPIPDPRSLTPDLGWEPIRCWRQVSSGAISIGETFTVVLTCAVYEGDNAQVVPDESRLGVASIQMAPFEILGGSHPPDVRRGSRRFFQYDYQLRIISPDAIGTDINVPPLTISYRVHSRVGAAATLEGRDLSYVMPMMPIKVLSLVPADATDIRDASEASLAAVDSLRFRSSLFQVLTLTFGALAAVMVVLALIPLARSTSTVAAAERDRIPDRSILDVVVKELGEVQSQAAHDGWTDDRIARAAGLIRIVAAAAIEQPISQRPLAAGEATPDGRLRVAHGMIRPVVASVSSAVTSDDVTRAHAERGSAFSTTRLQQLEGLRDGLAQLNMALYRRDAVKDAGALDDAIRHAIIVGREIAGERSWLRQWKR